MTFAEKLKSARKAVGMSQETLAEKLGVSRQAVTKWETERGTPDIENMMVISNLFGISVDEFLSNEKNAVSPKGYLYESVTEYDIDGQKRFDMKLGGASLLKLIGTDSEKIIVRLMSNNLSKIGNDFKVRIDDIKGRIDVDVHRKNDMTEAIAKKELIIEVFLPNELLSHVELEINCDEMIMSDLDCEHIEFKGKTNKLVFNDVKGRIEVDCNIDMNIQINEFSGALEINQISSTSQLTVPYGYMFRTIVKGIRTSVSYDIDGEPVSDFSNDDAENIIEFNGVKSELVISQLKGDH